MRLVIFGLTVSSSWGNGHATLWRGLSRALADRGHEITFFERDVPYYSENRDLNTWTDGKLILYSNWPSIEDQARTKLRNADAAIVTSFCPDALPATDLLESTRVSLKIFYDLDTPVTLAEYRKHGSVSYIPPDGLRRFDLVISFTGGLTLGELQRLLGARKVATLYGHADPKFHRYCEPVASYRADLSYLGTYAKDRQSVLNRLLVAPARLLPERRFLVGGALYPVDFPWAPNIYFVQHLPPSEHAAFFSSSRLTLNVTRLCMAEMGYCPSGRLFEAACCQTPILSDYWPGLEEFFHPGKEILLARNAEDVTAALSLGADRLKAIGTAGRNRVLAEHTSGHRARELEELLNHV